MIQLTKKLLKSLIVLAVTFTVLGMIGGQPRQALSQQDQTVLEVVESGSLNAGEHKVIEDFERAYPNINVKVEEIPWGQVFQQMVTRARAHNLPDIWISAPARYIPVFAEMGVLAPIGNYLSPGRKAEYFDSIWPMVTYRGTTYGIPVAFSTKALYWNKDLFAQAGIQGPPTNWDELREDAKAITAKTEAWGIGLDGMGVISTASQFLNYLYQNGGRVFDQEGNVILNNEKGVDALKFYVGLKEFAPNPIENAREKTLATLFRKEKIAMYIGGPWRRHGFTTGGVNYGVAPLPRGHSGPSSSVLVADAALLFKTGKLDEAAKFALFYTNFQNQLIRDTGIGLGKEVNPLDPTALTPMRKIEAQLPFFKQEPTWKAFMDMIPRGIPQPMVSSYPTLRDAINKAIQKALLGKASPKEALDEAAATIAELAPVHE